MQVRSILGAMSMLAMLAGPSVASAEEAFATYRSLTVDVALDLARAALNDCRQNGHQVAVAVVDRFGVTQVVLRDRFAGPHTVTTATGKAWTAVSFRTNTTELVAATGPGMPQSGVRGLPGATIIGGGLMIEAGGSIVGGIGVSGAPGGDADDVCAKAGIEKIRNLLDF
ncbi:MAG: heme-binding protein [Rhodospirillales bacterium]|nr:heme-binding protein [Rhodospirillales bacterium]